MAADSGSLESIEAKAMPPKLDCLRKSLRDALGVISIKIGKLRKVEQGTTEVLQTVFAGIGHQQIGLF